MLRVFIYLSILTFLNFSNALAQDKASCQSAYPIMVDLLGNPSPVNSSKYDLKTEQDNFILYYSETGNPNSFWYKINTLKDCDIELMIKPLETGNWYNFFVYKNPKKDDFCKSLYNYDIIPIRTNLHQENMDDGVGLKQESNQIINNNVERWENTYHTAYQKAIKAKANDEYFINVYHTKGSDCGHELELRINNLVQGFTSIHKGCYDLPIKKLEKNIPVTNTDMLAAVNKAVQQNFKNLLVLKLTITDSLTNKKIPATATIQKKDIFTKTKIDTNENIPLLLEGAMRYKITVSAIGYKERTFKVIKQTLKQEIKNASIALRPLKKGENFVLDDIYFYSGTYAFKPEADSTLQKLANYLKTNENINIEIQGHTNGKGNIKKKSIYANKGKEWQFSGNEKKLSKKRAEAVKNTLVNSNIASKRIKTVGMGAEKMLYKRPKTKREKDLNKRVEVLIK